MRICACSSIVVPLLSVSVSRRPRLAAAFPHLLMWYLVFDNGFLVLLVLASSTNYA